MKVLDEWKRLTLSQFCDKKILGGVIRAFSEILQEAYEEQQELRMLLNINKMEGINLDNIGDILCLSRMEAHQILLRNDDFEMTDELYRKVLKYKIILNNSDATYYDIVKGIKLIWNLDNVVYREDSVNMPATYILDLKSLDIDNDDILSSRTMTIKSGGIKVLFIVTWRTSFTHDFWKIYTSHVKYGIRILFFGNKVRTWDGSWKLNGTYRLDAEMNRTLGVIFKCKLITYKETMRVNHVFDIPDRLLIQTYDNTNTYVLTEPAVFGSRGIEVYGTMGGENMEVHTAASATVDESEEFSKVSGEKIYSTKSEDILVSRDELYCKFIDDGLMIYFADNIDISLEIAPTMV